MKLVKEAHKKLGGLDILACVAVKQHAIEKIADVTTKQLEQTYRVNVFALFWLCKAALSLMREHHHYRFNSGDTSKPDPIRLGRTVIQSGIPNCPKEGITLKTLKMLPEGCGDCECYGPNHGSPDVQGIS